MRAQTGFGSTGSSRSRRLSVTPGVVFLAVALIGSLVFVLYAITVRDASQIPLLAAGAIVLGIVFLALAAVHAARDLARRASRRGMVGRWRSASAAGSRRSSGPAASRAPSSCSSCRRQVPVT